MRKNCYFNCLGKNSESIEVIINTDSQKLLGVIIDDKVNFEERIRTIF